MPHNIMSINDSNHVQIGGRKSKLAVVQSELVKRLLKILSQTCPVLYWLYLLWVIKFKLNLCILLVVNHYGLKELEILLLDSIDEYPQLDLIVHSLKDMPTNLPEEFELGCIFQREDPRDAVVMKSGSPYKLLKDLPAGAIVGTSSIRRLSQLIKTILI